MTYVGLIRACCFGSVYVSYLFVFSLHIVQNICFAYTFCQCEVGINGHTKKIQNYVPGAYGISSSLEVDLLGLSSVCYQIMTHIINVKEFKEVFRLFQTNK